jgi:hypothetical protein
MLAHRCVGLMILTVGLARTNLKSPSNKRVEVSGDGSGGV